jgi:4-oxalocrotonate tautomerase
MPHVNIKHFPVTMSGADQARLVAEVTQAVTRAFRCEERVISIALETVAPEVWDDRVYQPEIVGRPGSLRKIPCYDPAV